MQTQLNSDIPPYSNQESWGDPLSKKQDNIIRFAFRNVNSFPIHTNDIRNDDLISDINKGEFDLLGIVETNIAWNKLSRPSLPSERFRGKFESSHWIFANNIQDSKDVKQIQQSGGSLMVCVNALCHRVLKSGGDTLGRWMWMLLRGKGTLQCGIISLYRAVKSTGDSSAYRQQQRELESIDDDTCPREAILRDLLFLIDTWQNTGIQIIIMGDFNEDVTSNKIRARLERKGLKEVFLNQHGQPPNTYNRGTRPIDGIFTTNNLTPLRCGYTASNWGLHTDHRLLWMDVDVESLFGTLHPPWIPRARRLKLVDPRIVKKFLQIRIDLMEKDDIIARTKGLLNNIMNEGMTTTNCQLLEKIDSDRTSHMLIAEQGCRKLHMGNVAWSPPFQQAIANIRYLRMCIKRLKGSNINARTMVRLHKRCTGLPQPKTILTATQSLSQAYQEYNILKKEAISHRYDFLMSLAQAKAENLEGASDTIYKVMLAQEQSRRTARQIKSTLKPHTGGLVQVEAPDQFGIWKVWDQKEDIEQRCMEENSARFTQANHTPSLLPSQRTILGWTAQSEISSSILSDQCDFDSSQLHQDLKQTLPFFHRSPQITDIEEDISESEYIYRWSRCNEFTSTGMSGLHFGHFRASCMNKTCAWLDRILCEIPLKTGYSLRRWHKCIDVMIPKKKTSIRVDKLRTICLMEADFNYLNKLLGRRVLANAEKHNDIAIEQFGSRKAKSAIRHAINKQLVFDIARQCKQAVALLVLDAKSCYDRIAPPIAALALQRWGLSQTCTGLMFQTIQNMSHYIRTAFGNSNDTYGPTNQPFHGVLQGNGAGPAIWVAVSSPLLDKMRHDGFGMKIQPLYEPNTQNVVGFAFVDDCDLLQSLSDSSPNELEETQRCLDTWVEELRSTGGALVPEKCNWFKLKYYWENDKWHLESKQTPNTQFQLFMTNDTGEREEINQLESLASILALGVQFSPSGQMVDQCQVLTDKAQAWAENVRCGKLQRTEAWQALTTTVFKSIEYPLPATTMSLKQCETIVRPILQIGLPRSGICRNISRQVAFSSTQYKGLGLQHPYMTQGIQKLLVLLDDPAGLTNKLVRISLELCAYESGLGNTFMLYDYTHYKHCLTYGWIVSLWEFVSHYNVRLHCHDAEHNLQEHRIMQHIHQIPPGQQRIFNYCRLYLGIEYVRELFNSDLRKVRKSIWEGTHTVPMVMTSIYSRPPTPRPSNAAWSIWRKCLIRIWNVNESGLLSTGAHIAADIPHSKWIWFYCHEDGRLYEKKEADTIRVYSPITSIRRRSARWNKVFQCHTPIVLQHSITWTSCTPVSLFHKDRYHYQIEGQIPNIRVSHTTSDTGSFSSYYSWVDRMSTHLHGTMEEIHPFISTEPMIAVSDGSVRTGLGAAAWVITTRSAWKKGLFISGQAPIPQEVKELDSHRAELYGLLGINETFMKYFGTTPTSGLITYSCDNNSALMYACNTLQYPRGDSTFPDYDLIQAFRASVPKDTQLSFKHVKGHQDKKGHKLNLLEEINVYVDTHAAQACEALQRNPDLRTERMHWISPLVRWQVQLKGWKVVKNISKTIYDYASRSTMANYYMTKDILSIHAFDSVDWGVHGSAMQSLTAKQRQWSTKHTFGFCGVNKTLVRWNQKTSAKCARCDEIEDTTHVWTCTHEETQLCWTNFLIELKLWMNEQRTNPKLINILIEHFTSWSRRNSANVDNDTKEKCSLLLAQDLIGWDYLLEGMISTSWIESQTSYFQSLGLRRTGRRWATQLLLKFWGVCWDLWGIRNAWEHKVLNEEEAQIVRNKVESEIHQGFWDLPRLRYLYSNQRLAHLRLSSISYQKSWLKNLEASRGRAQRRGLPDSDIRNMQSIMRNFLIRPDT